jgi:hypothetical protein
MVAVGARADNLTQALDTLNRLFGMGVFKMGRISKTTMQDSMVFRQCSSSVHFCPCRPLVKVVAFKHSLFDLPCDHFLARDSAGLSQNILFLPKLIKRGPYVFVPY